MQQQTDYNMYIFFNILNVEFIFTRVTEMAREP